MGVVGCCVLVFWVDTAVEPMDSISYAPVFDAVHHGGEWLDGCQDVFESRARHSLPRFGGRNVPGAFRFGVVCGVRCEHGFARC